MKRIKLFAICVALIFCAGTSAMAKHEKLIRETYSRLEIYNAAAQVLQNEFTKKRFTSEDNLRFELGEFRSGDVKEILGQPYAELITLPNGDIISLTRGTHSLDGGPEEATFAAVWERGQYASLFDPQWTIADAFHFEPQKYYDIVSYTSYQVTVRLEGRSRTYRALALFHEKADAPEFWDAVVNGVTRVWAEKRPPYKTKSATQTEVSSLATDVSLIDDGGIDDGSGGGSDGSSDGSDGGTITEELPEAVISIPLPFWFSSDLIEHVSGEHGGTANYTGTCTPLTGGFQRCAVVVSNFGAFEVGTLEHFTPLFAHVGSKDLKTENRTGPLGTAIQCASATGVAFSTCFFGTNCGSTAQVTLSLGIGTASTTVTGGNLWRDANSEHFSCNLPAPSSSNCVAPGFGGTCPSGSRMIGGECCFSTSTTCSQPFASKCLMFG